MVRNVWMLFECIFEIFISLSNGSFSSRGLRESIEYDKVMDGGKVLCYGNSYISFNKFFGKLFFFVMEYVIFVCNNKGRWYFFE